MTDAMPAPPSLTEEPRLRVLMVCVKYLPLSGGTELHVAEVTRRLAALGHDVTVLTVAHDPALLGERVEDGVRVIRVKAYGARVDAFLAPAMWRIVRDRRWDIVHCQGFHTLVAPLALVASLLGGRHRPIVTFHRGGHSSPLRRRLTAIQSRALRPLLTRAERLVAVSRFEASLFADELALPVDRFLVIPNGTRIQRDPTVELPLPAGDLILSVGRLEAYKGHQRIVGAMPAILARRPEMRLRIAGAGPYEGELRALVARLGLEERVTIAAVPASDPAGMARLLAEAAVVVTLSDYESQPLAVLEALALGRPTLVQYCSGNMEFVDDGLARSVPEGSGVDAVAEAVLDILDTGWAPPAVGLPDWDACTARTLELYAEVPAGSDPGRAGRGRPR